MLTLNDWRWIAYGTDDQWQEMRDDDLNQFAAAISRSVNVANAVYTDRAQQIRLLRTKILGTRPLSDKRLTKRLDEYEQAVEKLYKKVQKAQKV